MGDQVVGEEEAGRGPDHEIHLRPRAIRGRSLAENISPEGGSTCADLHHVSGRGVAAQLRQHQMGGGCDRRRGLLAQTLRSFRRKSSWSICSKLWKIPQNA